MKQYEYISGPETSFQFALNDIGSYTGFDYRGKLQIIDTAENVFRLARMQGVLILVGDNTDRFERSVPKPLTTIEKIRRPIQNVLDYLDSIVIIERN